MNIEQYIDISWSLCSIHLSRNDIRASAAQHHCISSHQRHREATEELAGGFSLFTALLPCQSLPNAPHHASCHTVEAAKSLHRQGEELQPLGSASIRRISHFPIIGFFKSLASFSCRACHISWGERAGNSDIYGDILAIVPSSDEDVPWSSGSSWEEMGFLS